MKFQNSIISAATPKDQRSLIRSGRTVARRHAARQHPNPSLLAQQGSDVGFFCFIDVRGGMTDVSGKGRSSFIWVDLQATLPAWVFEHCVFFAVICKGAIATTLHHRHYLQGARVKKRSGLLVRAVVAHSRRRHSSVTISGGCLVNHLRRVCIAGPVDGVLECRQPLGPRRT